MRKFVENFTTLDIKAWDLMIARADKSGPGMIRTIAQFCHKNSEVTNKPNIGNVIVGFSKALGGDKLKGDEMAALADGLKDKKIANVFIDIFKR
jgi:hypothetical protein